MLLKFRRKVRKMNEERLISIPREILDAFAFGQPIDILYDGERISVQEVYNK